MEQPKLQNTEKILSKLKKAEISDAELQATFSRTDKPLFEKPFDKEGVMESEFEGKKLVLGYKTLSLEDQNTRIQDSIRVGLGNVVNPEEWRQITQLELLDGDSIVLDFIKSAPSDYKLFINPSKDFEWGFVVYPDSRVYIIGEFTFRSLLTVLHEIGHIWDQERLEASGRQHLMDDHKHAVRAEVLRRERAASAFAFAKLRTMTKNELLRKDGVNFLKYFALKDYYERAEKAIAHDEYMSNVVAKDFDQASMDAEEEERQIYEDWLQWKKSSMYEMWKAHREPMDEYDEYGKWREWLQESGYNYHKDLPEE